MQFIPYLDFDGDCRDAFDFYARVFDGQVTMRTTDGESPMAQDMPDETHGRVMGPAHLRRAARGRQRFGMPTDRYGKGWIINCLKPAA